MIEQHHILLISHTVANLVATRGFVNQIKHSSFATQLSGPTLVIQFQAFNRSILNLMYGKTKLTTKLIQCYNLKTSEALQNI